MKYRAFIGELSGTE